MNAFATLGMASLVVFDGANANRVSVCGEIDTSISHGSSRVYTHYFTNNQDYATAIFSIVYHRQRLASYDSGLWFGSLTASTGIGSNAYMWAKDQNRRFFYLSEFVNGTRVLEVNVNLTELYDFVLQKRHVAGLSCVASARVNGVQHTNTFNASDQLTNISINDNPQFAVYRPGSVASFWAGTHYSSATDNVLLSPVRDINGNEGCFDFDNHNLTFL